MYRRFIAAIATASVIITGIGAVPAYADDRDTARALAAILGIAVIGAAIHDRNKKKKRSRVQTHRYADPVRKHQPAYTPPRYQPPVQPRPLPQRVNRTLLPKQCFRNYDTRRGSVQMFSKRCLRKNFAYAEYLPRQCEYVFSTLRGDRRGYEARCLRDKGYRLARR